MRMKYRWKFVVWVICICGNISLGEILYVKNLAFQDVIMPRREELVPIALHAISKYQPQVALDNLVHGKIYYKFSEYENHADECFEINFYIKNGMIHFDNGWEARRVSITIRKDRPITSNDVSIVKVRSSCSASNVKFGRKDAPLVDWHTIGKSDAPLARWSLLTLPDRDALVSLSFKAIANAFPGADQNLLQFNSISCRMRAYGRLLRVNSWQSIQLQQ